MMLLELILDPVLNVAEMLRLWGSQALPLDLFGIVLPPAIYEIMLPIALSEIIQKLFLGHIQRTRRIFVRKCLFGRIFVCQPLELNKHRGSDVRTAHILLPVTKPVSLASSRFPTY